MIFTLKTLQDFLSCLGKGTVFVSFLRKEDDHYVYLLSGFSQVSRHTNEVAYVYIKAALGKDLPEAKFLELLNLHWMVYEGVVWENRQHLVENADNEIEFLVNQHKFPNEGALEESIAEAWNVIERDRERREKAEREEYMRKVLFQQELDKLKRQPTKKPDRDSRSTRSTRSTRKPNTPVVPTDGIVQEKSKRRLRKLTQGRDVTPKTKPHSDEDLKNE